MFVSFNFSTSISSFICSQFHTQVPYPVVSGQLESVRLLSSLPQRRGQIHTVKTVLNETWKEQNPLISGKHSQSRTVVFKVGHMARWGPHQVSNGYQEKERELGGRSNFWLGHRSFTVWIKYLKFKIVSKVPFSPAFPAAPYVKLYFIAFPAAYLVQTGFSWVTLAVKIMYPFWYCEERLSALITDHTATGHSKTCKCSLGPWNTLSIMTIINRIFLFI